MKNMKYESFGAGRAGQGRIDLQSGKLEFIHADTNTDAGRLPVAVSHVYSTSSASSDRPNVFGRGFRLNLEQDLRKVDDGDSSDTRHILTDAAGNEQEFMEAYYYLDGDSRVYHKKNAGGENIGDLERGDVCIDYAGRLTYDDGTAVHEIFPESRTDSGLVLRTDIKGFVGADRMQTKHEELLQAEEDVESLKRSRT